MCGFVGIAAPRTEREVLRHELDPMLATVRHRGPDEEGTALRPGLGVGFCRLAIVDPEHGQQPMSTPDGRLTLVCNGEIYNHRALRAELESKGYTFRTSCDCEVLLHAYDAWGRDLAERLRGIFAFALWDAPRRTLFLCRDRSGVKPLYLQQHGDELVFASEAKAVLCRTGGARRIDLLGCFAPREPGAVLIPSPFEGVLELGGGCSLAFTPDARIEPHRYWRYEPSTELATDTPQGTATADAAIARYREELLQVVPMELMADVPVGACLSGGLDSSVVAALAARHAPGLPVFTSVCEGSEDAWFAFGVARAAKLEPHFLDFEPNQVLDALPLVAWGAEGVFDLGYASRYALAVAAHERGLKVLLSGQGADELMGGYQGSYASLVASAERASAAAGLLHGGWADLADALRRSVPAAAEGPKVAALLARDHAGLAAHLLRYEDRMGMLAGVEIRVPLLDFRLVEICASLGTGVRRTLFGDKRLLREAAVGIVPDSVRLRPKYAFNAHLPPITQVLARARHEGLARELLTERSVRDKGYFEPRAVKCARDAGSYRMLDAVLTTHLLDELFVASFDPARFATVPPLRSPEVTVDASWMPAEAVLAVARKGPRPSDVPALRGDVISVGVLERVAAPQAQDADAPQSLLVVRFDDGRERLMPVPAPLDPATVAAFVRAADGMRTYDQIALALGPPSEVLLELGRFASAEGLVEHRRASGATPRRTG